MAAEQEEGETGLGDSLLDVEGEGEVELATENASLHHYEMNLQNQIKLVHSSLFCFPLDNEGVPTRKKRKRPEPRDPNAPKRPCSAYIFFSTETRLKMREEKADNVGMAERSKYIGKLWATLPLEEKKVCFILMFSVFVIKMSSQRA